MKRLVWISIGLIAVLIFLLGRIPDPPDWTNTYYSDGNSPMDLRILAERLPHLLPNAEVHITETSIAASDSVLERSDALFFIRNRFFPSETDKIVLKGFVEQGGRVLVSANYMDSYFLDSLNVDSKFVRSEFYGFGGQDDSARLCGEVQVDNQEVIGYCLPAFMILQRLEVWMPGESLADSDDGHTLVRVPFGEGFFYFHTEPAVFTNYALLKEGTSAYSSAILGLMSAEHLVVNMESYGSIARANRPLLATIWEDRALLWAWNILYVMGLLFMYFGAKRRLRAIPVVKPYANSSAMRIRQLATRFRQNDKDRRLLAQLQLERIGRSLDDMRFSDDDPRRKMRERYEMLKKRTQQVSVITIDQLRELDHLIRDLSDHRLNGHTSKLIESTTTTLSS